MNKSKTCAEERLIQAAVKLFSQRGFSGTSTREIARLADVNETSLFRHFPRKQDLFWAAMDDCFQRLRVRKELHAALCDPEKPEVAIALIFELLVNISTYEPELAQLLYVGLLELRPGAEEMYRTHVAPIFQVVHGYLKKCIESGTLCAADPWIATTVILTTVLADQHLRALTAGVGRPFANSDEAARTYSRFWLTLLAPRAGTSPGRINRGSRAPSRRSLVHASPSVS